MERLQVDFAMQRGHEMIVQRDPPLARAELDEVDLQMLQSVQPPGLLAVDWFEMDGSITFRYAIDGRKLLPHRLLAGPFGMDDYLGLLLGIVEALDNCGHYLLREACCLLEEKFLYIGDDWRDAALTYLPLREPAVKKPVREELLGLAVRLIGKVERVDGDAVQAVLRLLDDPAASWSRIRVGLLQLLASDRRGGAELLETGSERGYRIPADSARPDAGGQPDCGTRQAETHMPGFEAGQMSVPGTGHADERTGESDDWLRTADQGEQPEDAERSRFGLLGRLIRREEPADTPPPETSMFDDREWPGTTGRIRDTGRARWLSACGAVLAAALIWRYIYLPSPGTDRLLISLGATLLTAGGLFLLWQRLGARSQGMLDDSHYGGESSSGDPDRSGSKAWLRESLSGGPDDDGVVRNDAAEIRFSWLAEFAKEHAEQVHHLPEDMKADIEYAEIGSSGEETGHLTDETVLLNGDGAMQGGGKFWLVREHEGQQRRIPVEPGTAVIGRSEAHARIVDTAEGVSRTHLEIACDGTDVKIKDLASRNGTLLGGEIMVPYKEYVLRDGSVFRLAGPEGPKYTLRQGG